ncbi:response regulator transcription factor [Peribacillus sp. NPDC097895]|uniref:response regulator transcription factor n=1 Tax=Peribacillus sp. NPDC097895 TaxID=3390619 RepID=UPI003D01A5B6
MASDYTIHENVQKLSGISSHEEQLYKILEVYLELFPVQDAYLFRYSPLGYLAEGIILLSSTGLVHIREIRDDIRSLSIVYSAIREKKAKYCSGIEYLKQMSSRYIISSSVNSMVVVPICYGSSVIGYICSTEFIKGATFNDEVLSSFTLYGKLIGKFIENFNGVKNSSLLSKRELEVMRKIAWGESTKEMAYSMDISEFTVKQYVKSAIKKLGATNRSHAVGELFRQGIFP